MKNNNRKIFDLYTQGQRFAARALFILVLCIIVSSGSVRAALPGPRTIAWTLWVLSGLVRTQELCTKEERCLLGSPDSSLRSLRGMNVYGGYGDSGGYGGSRGYGGDYGGSRGYGGDYGGSNRGYGGVFASYGGDTLPPVSGIGSTPPPVSGIGSTPPSVLGIGSTPPPVSERESAPPPVEGPCPTTVLAEMDEQVQVIRARNEQFSEAVCYDVLGKVAISINEEGKGVPFDMTAPKHVVNAAEVGSRLSPADLPNLPRFANVLRAALECLAQYAPNTKELTAVNWHVGNEAFPLNGSVFGKLKKVTMEHSVLVGPMPRFDETIFPVLDKVHLNTNLCCNETQSQEWVNNLKNQSITASCARTDEVCAAYDRVYMPSLK